MWSRLRAIGIRRLVRSVPCDPCDTEACCTCNHTQQQYISQQLSSYNAAAALQLLLCHVSQVTDTPREPDSLRPAPRTGQSPTATRTSHLSTSQSQAQPPECAYRFFRITYASACSTRDGPVSCSCTWGSTQQGAGIAGGSSLPRNASRSGRISQVLVHIAHAVRIYTSVAPCTLLLKHMLQEQVSAREYIIAILAYSACLAPRSSA